MVPTRHDLSFTKLGGSRFQLVMLNDYFFVSKGHTLALKASTVIAPKIIVDDVNQKLSGSLCW